MTKLGETASAVEDLQGRDRSMDVPFEDIWTLDIIERRLEQIEKSLGKVLNLQGPDFREQIIALSDQGELEETELVADWNELYSMMMQVKRWREEGLDRTQ
jgi:hypothetical protein